MSRRILGLLIIMGALAMAVTDAMAGTADSDNVHYSRTDSIMICRLLAEAETVPDTENIPLFFARKFLGRPYVAHTLEIFDKEHLVVNTSELDCTTLVETVAALTLCAYRRKYTFADYLDVLKSLRYRGGIMSDYTSRLHYFSDWIDDKRAMGIVTEICEPVPPFSAVQRLDIHYMGSHTASYKSLAAHPEFVPVIKKQESALTGRRYRYIPKDCVGNNGLMRKAVEDGDIIAITCRKKGLDIAHLGYAVWRNDGLHLLNASMIHHKVVEEPMTLYRFLQKHPSHTGIRIVRINKCN